MVNTLHILLVIWYFTILSCQLCNICEESRILQVHDEKLSCGTQKIVYNQQRAGYHTEASLLSILMKITLQCNTCLPMRVYRLLQAERLATFVCKCKGSNILIRYKNAYIYIGSSSALLTETTTVLMSHAF